MPGAGSRTAWLAACAAGLVVCGLVATVGLLSPYGRGQPVVLKDRLDAEADKLAMLTAGGYSQAGAAPGRWHHLDPAALDSERTWARATNEKNVALFKNMPPTGHSAYSPTDHLLARGSAWLANDGERAPLMEEANRVLGHYDDDVRAKGGLDWDSIGAFKTQPGLHWPGSPVMARPGPAGSLEGHEGMRGTLDAVNSHVYGQPPMPVFDAGDRSYLEMEPRFRPTGNVLPARAEVWPNRMTKESAAATYRTIADMGQSADDYTIRRFRRQSPWVGYHLDNADKHLAAAHGAAPYAPSYAVPTAPYYGEPVTEDAMRAYIAAVSANKRGQGSAATNYIISEYKKRLAEAARRRVWQPTPETAFGHQAGASPSAQTAPYNGPAQTPGASGYSKISPQKGPAQAAPAAAGYAKVDPPEAPNDFSKITFQRIDRTVPAAGGGSAGDDVREARVDRVAHEAAEAAAEDVAAEVDRALKPLQTRISEVEAKIASASATAALPPGSPAGANGMSFSIPGPIKIDHLELPAGEYSFNMGAGAGKPSAAGPAPAAAPAPAPAVAVGEDEGYPEGVLDKRKDMHVDLDRAAVKQAAVDLQHKVVSEFEAQGEDGAAEGDAEAAAAGEDDVMDSATGMDRGVDASKVRAAAVALQKRTLEDAKQPSAGAGDAADDVLDTAKHAAAHVDRDAMRAAAEDLQRQVVSNAASGSSEDAGADEGDDDVLDTASGMDTGVDASAVKAAAQGILESTLDADGKSKDAAADEGDDVLDTASGMDTGVDASAVKAAAQEILESTLDADADADAEEESGDDDVLDSSKMMDSGIDRAAVKAAADELLKAKLGNGDVLNSAKKMDRGVDGSAVAKAAKALEHQVIATKKQGRKGVVTQGATARGVTQRGAASGAEAEWGKKQSALAKEIERRLKHAAPPQGKQAKGHPKALKSRFQMLSDTMLMPINVVHDPSDTYLDPVGGTRHEEDIRAMYGSLERSDLDREKMLNIKDLEDTTEDQPDILRPHDFAGGVGTKAHLHQVGNQIGAWYSSWWEHPNVEDLEEETQEMFGLASDVSGEPAGTDEGKRKLILKGLNVNGWEPGRTTEEVREDHLTHTQVSPGFWNDDLTQAEPADTTVHHPCGSPLRKRPCEDEEEHTLPPAGGSDSPVTANANRAGGHQRVAVNFDPVTRAAKDPIWVDPVPLEVLCKGRVNATWCPGDDDEGEEDEDEDDAGDRR